MESRIGVQRVGVAMLTCIFVIICSQSSYSQSPLVNNNASVQSVVIDKPDTKPLARDARTKPLPAPPNGSKPTRLPIIVIPAPSRPAGITTPVAHRQSTNDDDLLAPLPAPADDSLLIKPLPKPSQDDDLLQSEPLLAPAAVRESAPLTDPSLNDDDLLTPIRSSDIDMSKLLEQREQSAKPYPTPDFSTPAEKVVPIPIQPAPESFRGFEPESSGDMNLPEPRRITPLPKVAVPVPQMETPPGTAVPWDTQQPHFSEPMPWQSMAGESDGRFESLLGGGTSARSVRRAVQAVPVSASFPPSMHGTVAHEHGAIVNPDPNSLRERLNDKYWNFKYARELPCEPVGTPVMSSQTCLVPYDGSDFAPIPFQPKQYEPCLEIQTYYGKQAIDTQRPWVEWWRPFYTGGMYEPGVPVFSDVNLLTPSFLVYGDYRTAVGVHRDKGQHVRSWAHRLNLDMDMRLTSTERFHMFTGPLDHNGRFTRLDFSDGRAQFEEELDFQLDTAFFEGDLGAMTGSWIGDDAPFDLPFTCGLVPLLYQNGIWMEDAIAGFALSAPWKHSRALNWANYEATFFAGFNQVTSPAFANDNNAASVYGTAWFIEAYNGYIEMDYAYLDDLDNQGRSYHNAAIAYTRRYFGRISNSVRLIGNAGQSGPADARTADGGILLFENSLISSQPSTIVPYWNFFVGSGRPQSVARAAGAGGILRNTGINFETDGLTGYPTLNATASNSYGGAVGVNVLSADFRRQWVTEFAALDTYGDPALSDAAGPQYGIGTRYQRTINNRSLWRVDFMNGWFDNAPDVYGTRTEFRWKF
jgi:hypothetical protein